MTLFKECPFCCLPSSRLIEENDVAVAVRDGYPVSPGHTLIISKRHVGSFFALQEDEVAGMLALLHKVKLALDKELSPASFNIGVNDGPAAGQTIAHVHMHLIPRYEGDQADPRGGVRWVIPDTARYWEV